MIRRSAVAVFAAAAVVALLCGCSIGGPSVSANARCDGPAFTSGDKPPAPVRTLITVELSWNSDEAREAVVRAIDPTVSRAVAEGGVIRLVVSGGEGEPLVASPCLDGTVTIYVNRNNDETERRARETAVSDIEDDVRDLLEEKVKISKKGNLTNLLGAIPNQLSSLVGEEGTEAGAPTRVLLVSDLNNKLPASDCLNAKDMHAVQPVANALVGRCLRAGQFRPLPRGVALEIVRPQLTSSDNAGEQMSTYLEKSLCARLSGEGGECVAAAAGVE